MLKYKLPYCILENNCIFALAKVFQNGQLFKTENQKSFPKSLSYIRMPRPLVPTATLPVWRNGT